MDLNRIYDYMTGRPDTYKGLKGVGYEDFEKNMGDARYRRNIYNQLYINGGINSKYDAFDSSWQKTYGAGGDSSSPGSPAVAGGFGGDSSRPAGASVRNDRGEAQSEGRPYGILSWLGEGYLPEHPEETMRGEAEARARREEMEARREAMMKQLSEEGVTPESVYAGIEAGLADVEKNYGEALRRRNEARDSSPTPIVTGPAYFRMEGMYDDSPEARAVANYGLAKELYGKAGNMMDASFKGSGLLRGMKDTALDWDTWTSGLTKMVNDRQLDRLYKKVENGETLTADEGRLLDAATYYTLAGTLQQLSSPSVAYSIGKGFMESVPYMIEFALTYGLASSVTRGLARAVSKKLGRNVSNKIAKSGVKVLAKGTEAATTGAVQTPMSFGRIAADTRERMMGDPQVGVDKEGKPVFLGRGEGDDFWTALGKSVGAQYITNISEVSGVIPVKVFRFLSKPAQGAIRKLTDSKYIKSIRESGFVKGARAFGKPFKIGSAPEELFEEYFEGTLNASMIGDTDLESLYSWRSLSEIAGVVLLTQAVMGGLGMVENNRFKGRLVREYGRAEESFSRAVPDKDERDLIATYMNLNMNRTEGATPFDVLARQAAEAAVNRHANDFMREDGSFDTAAAEKYRADVTKAISGYFTVKPLYDAYLSGITGRKKQDEERIREEIAGKAAGESGQIITVILPDGRRARVTGGHVVPTPDGRIDVGRSGDHFTAVYEDDGSTVQLPVEDSYTVEVVSVEDAVEAASRANDEMINREEEEAVYGPRPKLGETVTMLDSEGNRVQLVVSGEVDESGNFMAMPMEDFDNNVKGMAVAVNMSQIVRDDAASEGVDGANEAAGASLQESGEGVAGEAETESTLSQKGNGESGELASEGDAMAEAIGRNRFGTIYQWTRGKFKEAAAFLRKKQGGYIKGVFHRDDIGDIDMIWGNDKAGLKHIIQKHIVEHDDFDSVAEAMETINRVIENGTESKQGTNISFDHEGYRVSIAQSGEGNWVLTAFDMTRGLGEKKRFKGDATIGDQNTSYMENGTLVSPQLESSESEGSEFEGEKQGESALSRIEKDAKGQPLYEKADVETAWDALVEQSEGDESIARDVAASMVKDKEAALKKMEKAPAKGATPAEKIADAKVRKENIDKARAELEHWQAIAGVSQSRADGQTEGNAVQTIKEETNTDYEGEERIDVLAGDNASGQGGQQSSPGRVDTGERDADGVGTTDEIGAGARSDGFGNTDRGGIEGAVDEGQSGLSRPEAEVGLNEVEASDFMAAMEAYAVERPIMELNPSNWEQQFGTEGKVSTPIGTVKMGENQISKLFEKGRSEQFGMIKPTLETPSAIIEVPSEATGIEAERASSLLFVKTFIGKNGEKIYYFKSVTVKKDGMEVSVSSHYDRPKRIKDALINGKLLYRFDGGAQTEHHPADASVTASRIKEQGISTSEGNESAGEKQGIPGKNVSGSPVGRSLNAEEADMLISQMEQSAEVAPEMELTPENWIREFGKGGIVRTPIGDVKQGENQYLKLAQQGRNSKLGMVRPTLERPNIIIEDERPAKEGESERNTSYVFVKTFTKSDGSRYYYFASVTVSKDGKEVVISSQERSGNRISKLLQQGKVAWIDIEFSLHPTTQVEGSVPLNDSNTLTYTDNQPALLGINSSELSNGKGNEKSPTNSELDEKIAAAESETNANPTEKQKEAEYSSIKTISGESGDAVTDNLMPNTEPTAIQGFDGYSQSEIKSIVQEYIQQKLDENDISANVVGIAIHGSRGRGNAKENSDLDVVVEYEGDIREDGMFNLLNDDDNGEALYIEGIRVDINPIRAQETGTLDKYMERSRKYDEEVLSNDSVEDSTVRYRRGEDGVQGVRRTQESEMEREVRGFGERMADRLGGGVRLVYSDEIADSEAHAEEKRRSKGYYDTATGEVVVVLDNNTVKGVPSVIEVAMTMMHEVVGHKGVRGLFGTKEDAFLDDVYRGMKARTKAEMESLYGGQLRRREGESEEAFEARRRRLMADEYIARVAEEGNNPGLLRRVGAKVRGLLRGLGVELAITDNEIRDILRRSARELTRRKDVAMNVREDGDVRYREKNGNNKKSVLETAAAARRATIPTAISSTDGTKILKNLDNLAKEYEEKKGNRARTFVGDVADALGIEKQAKSSKYAIFETKNGRLVTIRLSNHNATVSNFDNVGEREGISIVVTGQSNNGITNDGEAHVVEFFYSERVLRQSEGKPLSEIIRSIKQSLYSGEFNDKTGLAEREEVNVREDGDVRYRQSVNERFNEELKRYERGEMGNNEMFHLGNPQGVMRIFLPNLPIVMRQRIVNKGPNKKHDVEVSALMNMPQMISEPIFVFKKNDSSLSALTEMKDRNGRNVFVAINIASNIQNGGNYLEVNDVTTVHGRRAENIIRPINENNSLKWVDKEKALAWFSSASPNVQQEITSQELVSAANIVKEFENPTVGGENVRYRLTEEEQGIVEEAKRDGSYMKAPNGAPTRLTEKQWAVVRTKAFKAWFGDWEKAARIEKLRKSEPVEISGEEYKGKYELNRDSAKQWMKDNLRGEYTNKDTGEKIEISKVGVNKVTSHGERDEAHLKSIVAIPQLIGNSIFIDEHINEKGNDKYDSYRYYVCGLKIDGEDYTAKIVIGVKGDSKYYDHRLTQIEKGTLINNLNAMANHVAEKQNADVSISKDTKLLSILQVNSLKDVDENGEPTIFEPTGEVDKSNGDEESGVLYRKVTDMDTLKRLEEEPTIKVYRAMANIDGKLYPPMSTKIDGKLRAPIELGVWEEAEERPDLVDEKGNFKLKKDNGTTVPARYNPYIHTSRTPLNDQFSSAYKRPNLVTVEVEVPVSELTSGYHAEKAKDSVGEKSWHAGPVSGKLPTGKKRKVILSRWDKPIRIVPDEEVAKKISEILDGENIPIPYNVITPSLRKELEKLGVLIKDVGRDDTRYRIAEEDYASVQDDASGEYAEALSAPMDISVADMMPIEAAENAQAAGLLRDVVNRIPDTKIAITDLSRVYAAAEVAEEEATEVRYRREVNERFNEELERQIAGELPKGHVYSLGRPSEVLLAAGIPDLPIELAASRLGLKASAEYESNHPFELGEVMNLPEAIQHPIAVFDSKTRVGSKVILVELKDRNGNNFVVAMNTNVPKSRYSKASIQINDIRSIYPKDNVRDIVGWINRGDLLRYADKKKIEDWITQQRSNSAEVEIQNLDVAANIVKEFENPKVGGENVRYRQGVNERFNDELQQQIDGTLPKGHVYGLGRPSEVLLSAGLPNLPIEMAASRLSDKSMQENHPFDLSEVKDLPQSIQAPMAVFRSATHIGSFVVMTEIEHRGRNFVVAIEANRKQGRIEVNSIRSIHYRRTNAHIANWIAEGLLEYADKKRVAEWFSKQRYNSADVRKLFNHAANIVKEFENPAVDGENVRYRRGISFDTRGASHRDTDITGRRERSFGEKASRLAEKAGISLYDEQLKLKQLQGKVAEWLTGSRKGALDDRLLFYEAENQAGSIAMDRKVRFDNEYRERLFALRAEVFKALGNKVDDKYYFYAKTLNERTGVIGEEAMAANKATMFSHLLSEQHPGHDFPEGFFDPKEYGYEALQEYARKEGWIDSIEGYIADCESRMGEKLVKDIWGVIGEIAEYQLTTSMKKGLITRDHFDRLMYGRPLAELVSENLEKGLITEGQYRAFLATDFTADELVKAGFITREQREGLKRRYEYYLPLKGDSEPTTEEVADYERSRSRVSWQIKSVKGGNTRLVNDPVSRLLADVYASISYQEKMAWIQSMYHALRLAERQGKGAGDFAILDNWVVKDETGDYVPYVRYVEGEPVFTPTEQEIAKGEVERARNLPIETAIRVPEAVQGEHIVKLKHRGRTIHIYFRDPAVANAVNNHFVPRNVPKLMKGLRAAGGFMGKVYTQWNIFFSVRNLSKDFGEAAINNYVQYGGRYMAEYMVNYWRVMRRAGTTLRGAKRSLVPRNDYERRVEEFFKYGGEVSYTQIESYDKAIRDFERELKRSADKRGVVSVTEAGFVKIGEAVSAANKLIELNARLATFITSRERGYGLRQSIRDAKEVTVNFDRRGRNSMEFGSLFLFWNAGRQSNRRKWELMRENPGRFWTSRAAMGLLNVAQTYVLGSALAAVFGVDWEDYMTGYYDIPDYIRYNNIVVMSADGKVYRIPLSPAFAPYKTLVENIGEATYRTAFNDRDGRYDWGKGMADIVKSVSADLGDLTTWEAEGGKRLIGWAPAPTVPLLEAMCNVDFTGRPVYKVGNSATPGYKRAYAGTKDVYVEITEWLNRVSGGEEAYGSWVGRRANPGAVQHVVEGYLGGLIQVLSKFWNVPEALKGASYERLPFVDTFYYGDAEMLGEREVRDDIYDARRLVESYNDVRSNFRKTDEDYDGNPKTVRFLENNEYRIDELKDLLKMYDEVTEELKSEDSEAYRRELRLLRRSIVELTNEMEEY